MSADKRRNSGQQDQDQEEDEELVSSRPVQRDRTPSIIVQSLELSFPREPQTSSSSLEPRDGSREASIEEQEPTEASSSGEDHSPLSESAPQPQPADSSSPAKVAPQPPARRPAPFRHQQSTAGGSKSPTSSTTTTGGQAAAAGNRRLSLTIGSTAPRRLSLTVDGMSSFINPAYKDLPAASTYSSGSATGSLRNKVALKPGHSLMGWVKLASTAKDLSGTQGRLLEVSPEELAKHDKEEDCWVAIKGNVYNVTTYLQYHPGGVEELMRGAGKEITELFNEVHCWVNYESILAKCLVGPYKMESPIATVG